MAELSNDEPLTHEHNSLLAPDAFHLPVGRPVTHKIYRDAVHRCRLVLPLTTRETTDGSQRVNAATACLAVPALADRAADRLQGRDDWEPQTTGLASGTCPMNHPDDPLPDAVAAGTEPCLIVGAVAGG